MVCFNCLLAERAILPLVCYNKVRTFVLIIYSIFFLLWEKIDCVTLMAMCLAMEEIFERNPTWRVLGKRKLKALFKTHNIKINAKQVDDYYARHAAHQVFLKPPKTSQQFKITAPPYSYQIDVVVLPQYKKQNGGVDRFLLLVEVLSKKAYAFILKSNKCMTSSHAMNSFYKTSVTQFP